MVEKTRVDGPPFGEQAEPQERKGRECVEKGSNVAEIGPGRQAVELKRKM